MATRKVTNKKMSMPREKPATRTELHAFRAEVRHDFKNVRAEMAAGFKNVPDEIDRRIAANNAVIFAKIEVSAAALRIDFEAIAARLLKAQQESFLSQFGALDDKYRDIPDRVTTLEDHAGITR